MHAVTAIIAHKILPMQERELTFLIAVWWVSFLLFKWTQTV